MEKQKHTIQSKRVANKIIFLYLSSVYYVTYIRSTYFKRMLWVLLTIYYNAELSIHLLFMFMFRLMMMRMKSNLFQNKTEAPFLAQKPQNHHGIIGRNSALFANKVENLQHQRNAQYSPQCGTHTKVEKLSSISTFLTLINVS